MLAVGAVCANESVSADAPEAVGVNMVSLVLRVRIGEETRTQTLSYAGKCGAGAVAKVSCTVAGITGENSLSVSHRLGAGNTCR